MTVKTGFNLARSFFGFVASVFWFCAAAPQPGEPGIAYWRVRRPGPRPATPFAKAWRTAITLNKWAAALTGLSVFLFSVAALCPDRG
jgi:hypothetical protein